MPAIMLTPPAAEPWTVAEAKAFLRVEHSLDDALIASLIASARAQVEALTRCALLTQTWRIVLDAWPHDRIAPRLTPLQEVTAARVFDDAGHPHAIDTGRFLIDGARGAIQAPWFSLPQPGRSAAGIELDLRAGYGATPDAVPERLRHAVRLLTAHWYENRGLVAIGQSVAMMPASVMAAIASHRVLSL